MNQHGEFAAELITTAINACAAGAVQRQEDVQADLVARHGAHGAADLVGDTVVRLLYLAEALAAGRSQLLEEQVAWQKVAMKARDLAPELLTTNLACMRAELESSLPSDLSPMTSDYLERAHARFASAPDTLPSRLEEDVPHVDLARRFLLAALEGRRWDGIELLLKSFHSGVSLPELHDVIALVQTEVGRMWQMAEIRVGEEHYCSETARQAMAQLRAVMPRQPANGKRVLCSTVGGELHGVGLEMIVDRLELAGFDAIVLGVSTPPPDLVHAVHDFEADVLAISATVATQVRATARLIAAVREHGPKGLPIVVGGSPFNAVPDLWQVVGADATAVDAAAVVAVVDRLCG